MCEPCRAGRHNDCIGDCDCQSRADERIEREIARFVNASADEGLAETIYLNLLGGGSEITKMLADGAGKVAVKCFIRQVLRTNSALRC